jgi:hypothetical protein
MLEWMQKQAVSNQWLLALVQLQPQQQEITSKHVGYDAGKEPWLTNCGPVVLLVGSDLQAVQRSFSFSRSLQQHTVIVVPMNQEATAHTMSLIVSRSPLATFSLI